MFGYVETKDSVADDEVVLDDNGDKIVVEFIEALYIS
jgi:hypothetical protein